MGKRALLGGMLVCCVLVTFLSAAHAGISGVSPAEGTVGTQLTLSGSGFGEKRGEVLLGPEKCKVLTWSDTAIKCLVTKPQSPGEYKVTVRAQGGKELAEPVTSRLFSMRRPRIIPSDLPDLVWDGETVTINGAFFGNKKGDVYLKALGGEIERARVMEWVMDSIRFEIPRGLTGRCNVIVQNAVGADARVIELPIDGPPLLGGPPGYDLDKRHNNSSAVYCNGQFYVFSIHVDALGDLDDAIIGYQFKDGLFYGQDIPPGQTDAQVVGMCILSTIWLLHTGQT